MRLRQYSKKKACYYCGAPPPGTQEHAPPRLMFAAFDCDHITVPSCDKHNLEKSNKDRAIVTALIKSLIGTLNDDNASNTLSQNVVKAINYLEPNFHQANREISERSLLKDIEPDLKLPFVNFSVFSWMKHLSAAMVWSITGEYDPSIDWDNVFVWNSLYLPGSKPHNLLEVAFTLLVNQQSEQHIESFTWEPGWSSMPKNYPSDIYNLRICFLPPFEQAKGQEVAICHQFYSRLNWYVWFTPSIRTREALRSAVESIRTK